MAKEKRKGSIKRVKFEGKTFGENLRLRRQYLGLSLRDVEYRLRITNSMLCKYEMDQFIHLMSVDKLYRMSRLFEWKPGDMIKEIFNTEMTRDNGTKDQESA